MMTTIKQLADMAGVSIATVSMALNDSPRVSPKTRKQIQNLAQSQGYVRSHLGRALQAGSSFLIGFLISNIGDSFYDEILQGAGQVITSNGYGLLVGVTENSPESETAQLRLFQEKQVDAVIVSNYRTETIPKLQQLEESGIPVVICDYESYAPGVPTVRTDDAAASEMVTEYLIGLGHRRFAYCFCRNENSLQRLAACRRMAEKHGLAAPSCCRTEEDLIALLKSDKPPTAVIGYSDLHAIRVKHLTKPLQLSIPDDLSVTGFDNLPPASWPEFDLTTIAQPRIGLGRDAATLAFRRIQKESDVSDIIIQPRLIIRGSTAAPGVK